MHSSGIYFISFSSSHIQPWHTSALVLHDDFFSWMVWVLVSTGIPWDLFRWGSYYVGDILTLTTNSGYCMCWLTFCQALFSKLSVPADIETCALFQCVLCPFRQNIFWVIKLPYKEQSLFDLLVFKWLRALCLRLQEENFSCWFKIIGRHRKYRV